MYWYNTLVVHDHNPGSVAKMAMETSFSLTLCVEAVYNWWTGLVDWTSGLDYWTDLFSYKTHRDAS